MSQGGRPAQRAAWTPTLVLAPLRGPAAWLLLAAGGVAAAVVAYRWARGHEDPFVNVVLLVLVGWTLLLGVVAGEPRRPLLAATPYALAALVLTTLAFLQATGDPGLVRHTNSLLGAYLALPVVYLLFFLLRRPSEALAAAIATLVAAAVLQLALPSAVAGRHTAGVWVGLLTATWHGLLLLLFYAVPRLRSNRDLLEAVIGSSRDAVVLVAPAREEGAEAGVRFRVTFANAAARHAFGAQPGLDLLADGPLSDAPELRERLGEALARGTEVRLNASLPTRAGPGWFRVTATRFWGGLAVTFADISEHKETETRALVLAHTDPLTGLANRRGFEAEAERRLGEAERAGRAVAMCYLDLDGFKAVNDGYGHETGDELLRHVAGRLRSVVRAADLIGRIGGDEFVVLAEGLNAGDAEAYFQRVRAAVDAPYSVGGARLDLTSSLGVVTRARTLAGSLARADAAMYRAKERGGGVELDGEPD